MEVTAAPGDDSTLIPCNRDGEQEPAAARCVGGGGGGEVRGRGGWCLTWVVQVFGLWPWFSLGQGNTLVEG